MRTRKSPLLAVLALDRLEEIDEKCAGRMTAGAAVAAGAIARWGDNVLRGAATPRRLPGMIAGRFAIPLRVPPSHSAKDADPCSRRCSRAARVAAFAPGSPAAPYHASFFYLPMLRDTRRA